MFRAGGCLSLLLLAFLPASRAARAGAHLRESGVIVPPLHPKSDKTFFHMDYPDDRQPRPSKEHRKEFDHPYPVVQDHETYDKDYVKDENSDNGEWKAQMDYDALRTKLREHKKEVDEAYKTMKAEERYRDEVNRRAKAAHEAAEKAKENSKHARESADKAKERLRELEGKTAGDGSNNTMGGEIGEAVGDVKHRMKTLEDCQKQLADAQAKLKKLMKERDEREKDMAEARAEAEAALHNKTQHAKGEYDAAVGNSSSAMSQEQALAKQDEEAHLELDTAEDHRQKAEKEYKDEKDEFEDEEARLEAAAEKLRKFRGQVDQNGGVTRKENKAGSRLSATASLLHVALAVPTLAWALSA